ncbi:MAG: flagellar basal body-associated FliL family protein [Bacteroidota bacterium]
MAKTSNKKQAEANGKAKKKAPKILSIGKYFLFMLILAGQGYLAYSIVENYYPSIYTKLNAKSTDDYGMVQLEELVVNPANTNGRRYLLVEISLELDNKEHIPLIETHNVQLKQSMIDALSSRSVSQLSAVEARNTLRDELIDIVNTTIEVESVRNLYFTKYVMQ